MAPRRLAPPIDVALARCTPHMQALIDGPQSITGVKRQVINFKWVALTDFVLSETTKDASGKVTRQSIGRGARQRTLEKFWKALDIKAKFEASSWGKRLAAKKAKAASTDFSRFSARVAKQTLAKKVRAKL